MTPLARIEAQDTEGEDLQEMSENLLYEWQQFREQIDYAHHVLDCNEAPVHPEADGTCKLTVGGRIASLITSKDQRIAAFTQQLADLTADRDSEHRWAEQYFREKQAAEKARDAAVEAQASAEAATKEAQRLMSESNLALSEALALARQAVEVLEGAGCHCMPERQCEVCAFLARPDVVKIGSKGEQQC